MAVFKGPCLKHISIVQTMDTILTDTSTKITQNEVTLTEVHGENMNVTNHDYGWRFHFRDKLNTKKFKLQPPNTYINKKSTYLRQHMFTIQKLLQHERRFILPPRLRAVSFLRYHPLTVLVTQPITILNVRNPLYHTVTQVRSC